MEGMMKRQKRFHLGSSAMAIAVGFSMLMLFSPIDARAGGDQVSASTADHTRFQVLNQPFAQAQDVTRACLSCHTEAGKQVQNTYHWTWQSKGGLQKGIGKKNVLNNF
jgi:hypothetical protein